MCDRRPLSIIIRIYSSYLLGSLILSWWASWGVLHTHLATRLTCKHFWPRHTYTYVTNLGEEERQRNEEKMERRQRMRGRGGGSFTTLSLALRDIRSAAYTRPLYALRRALLWGISLSHNTIAPHGFAFGGARLISAHASLSLAAQYISIFTSTFLLYLTYRWRLLPHACC